MKASKEHWDTFIEERKTAGYATITGDPPDIWDRLCEDGSQMLLFHQLLQLFTTAKERAAFCLEALNALPADILESFRKDNMCSIAEIAVKSFLADRTSDKELAKYADLVRSPAPWVAAHLRSIGLCLVQASDYSCPTSMTRCCLGALRLNDKGEYLPLTSKEEQHVNEEHQRLLRKMTPFKEN